jgi:hypothetical protein
MSAGLDALDAGVVGVGLLAAEALARVEALEAKADKLARAVIALAEAAGLAPPQEIQPPRHLTVVEP